MVFSSKLEVYVLRYFEGQKIIPVAVEIDLEHQTELVISLGPGKRRDPVAFYDFSQRKVAYKDLDTRQCFIGDIRRETLEGDRKRLAQLQSGIVKGFYTPTLIIHREIKNRSEVQEQFGNRINSFCNGSSVFYVTSDAQLSRKRRDTTSSGFLDRNGQFTHHSYGHYGHQTNNYAHYGHETHMTGTVDKDGIVRDSQLRQHQIRTQGSQSYPSVPRTSNVQAPPANGQAGSTNTNTLFQNNLPGRNFGPTGSGQFSLQTAQDSGYQLNLPFGFTAGNSYRGGVHSQGQYGVGGPQPQIHADSRHIAAPGTARASYRPPSSLQAGHSAFDAQEQHPHIGSSLVGRGRDGFVSPVQSQVGGGHRTDGFIVRYQPAYPGMSISGHGRTGDQRRDGFGSLGPSQTFEDHSRGGLGTTGPSQFLHATGQGRDGGASQIITPQAGHTVARDQGIHGFVSPDLSLSRRTTADRGSDSIAPSDVLQPRYPSNFERRTTDSVPQVRHSTTGDVDRNGFVPSSPSQTVVDQSRTPLATVRDQRIDGYTAPGAVRTSTSAGDRRRDGFVSPDQSQAVYPNSGDQASNGFNLPGFSQTGEPVDRSRFVPSGSSPTVDRSKFIPAVLSQTGDSQYGDRSRGGLQYPGIAESTQTAGDRRREGPFYAGYPSTRETKPGSLLPGTSQTAYPVPSEGEHDRSGSLYPGILQTRGSETGLIAPQLPGGSELTRADNRQPLPGQTRPVSSQAQVGDSVGYSGADSAFSQTEIKTGVEGTAAEASSAGQRRGHGSQTQVQGSHTGNGSFSAQAQSGFTGGATQSQVLGSNQGGISGSSALVEQVGSAQSQVQIGQPSGSASSSAQGRFSSGMTQVRTQTGKTGGSAGSESQSSGLSSSQVQVNINGEAGRPRTGFHGTVSASVRGGKSSGQSQTQLQGGYDSGRTYAATAQGGFDSTLGFKASVPSSGSQPKVISPMGRSGSELHPTSREAGHMGQLLPSGESQAQQIIPGSAGTSFTPSITDSVRDTSRQGINLEQVGSSRISNGQTSYMPSRHQIPSLSPEFQQPQHISSNIQPQSQFATRIPTNIPNTPMRHEIPQPDYHLGHTSPPSRVASGIPSHISAGTTDLSQPHPVLRKHEYQPTYIQPTSHVSTERPSDIPRSQPGIYESGFHLNQIQPLPQVSAELPSYIPGGSQVPYLRPQLQQPGYQPNNIETPSRVQTELSSYVPGSSQIPPLRPGLQHQEYQPSHIPTSSRPAELPFYVPGDSQNLPLHPEYQPSQIQTPIRESTGFPSQVPRSSRPALQYPEPQPSHIRFPSQESLSISGQQFPPEAPKSPGFQPGHFQQPSTHISPPRPDRPPEVPKSPDLGFQPGHYQQPSTHISPPRPDRLPEVPKSPDPGFQPGHYQQPSAHISPPRPDRPSTSVGSQTSETGYSGQQRPGSREPGQSDVGSCCDALRSLKRRCCDGSRKSGSSCCSRTSHFDDDFDFDDDSDERTSAEPCKVVKAICYIVYKPVGKARICKPTTTTSSRC